MFSSQSKCSRSETPNQSAEIANDGGKDEDTEVSICVIDLFVLNAAPGPPTSPGGHHMRRHVPRVQHQIWQGREGSERTPSRGGIAKKSLKSLC